MHRLILNERPTSRISLWKARRAGRRLARMQIEVVPTPWPWDLDEWLDRLEEHRGRRIDLVPFVHEPGSPSGAYQHGHKSDRIAYATNTDPFHQDFIILHEVGHLISGHPGVCNLHDSEVESLTPDLTPSALEHLLRPARYEINEVEAEAFALAIISCASAPPPVEPHRLDRAATAVRHMHSQFG